MSKQLNPRQYTVILNGLTPTTSSVAVASIAPSSTKALRVNGFTIWNPGKVTTAQVTDITLNLQSTAATGGSVATVLSRDGTPLPGTVRTGAITAGTAAGTVAFASVFTPSSLGAFNPPLRVVFDKPVVLSAGSKGAFLRVENGASGYTDLDVTLDVEA